MTELAGASVHASAVLVGDRAVLIRGPSGSGKSRLAFDLIQCGRSGQLPKAVLVGDDRVHLATVDGQLLVRPAAALAGLIEIHGLGIRRCNHAEQAIVGLIVDLAATDAARLPVPEALHIQIDGVKLPRIPVAINFSPLQIVIAALTTTESSHSVNVSDDCVEGISNHIRHSIATK
jgi:serine kinase of HPr protein (carbohydrate metabolism regulator)